MQKCCNFVIDFETRNRNTFRFPNLHCKFLSNSIVDRYATGSYERITATAIENELTRSFILIMLLIFNAGSRWTHRLLAVKVNRAESDCREGGRSRQNDRWKKIVWARSLCELFLVLNSWTDISPTFLFDGWFMFGFLEGATIWEACRKWKFSVVWSPCNDFKFLNAIPWEGNKSLNHPTLFTSTSRLEIFRRS